MYLNFFGEVKPGTPFLDASRVLGKYRAKQRQKVVRALHRVRCIHKCFVYASTHDLCIVHIIRSVITSIKKTSNPLYKLGFRCKPYP